MGASAAVTRARPSPARRSAAPRPAPASTPAPAAAPGAYYAAGPALSLGVPAQPKAQVGRANDPFEREADGVAEQVTNGRGAPPISAVPAGGLPGALQRAAVEPVPLDAGQVAQPPRIQRQARPPDERPAEQPATPPAPAPTATPAPPEPPPSEASTPAETPATRPETPSAAETPAVSGRPLTTREPRPEEKAAAEVHLPLVQRQADTDRAEEERPAPVQPFLVQRCGGAEPCGCDEEAGAAETEAPAAQASLVQRQPDEAPEEERPAVQPSLVQCCGGPEPCGCTEEEESAGAEEVGVDAAAADDGVEPRLAAIQASPAGQAAGRTGGAGATGVPASGANGGGGAPAHAAAPGASRAGGDGALGSQLQQTRGRGEPLDAATRRQLEPAFGADLSDVRVHTDGQAARLSEGLGAHAFTHGSDIYFGAGEYDPHSSRGRRLLAHELTHTVQQGATTNGVQGPPQTALIQRDVDCDAPKQQGGSPEQARQAETAPATGTCQQTNPPAEQPPEGQEEPAREELPAEVETNEGAPVDQRQANAPPPDEGAPAGEEGIAEEGARAAEKPQDPCAVRQAAGLGGPGATGGPAAAGAGVAGGPGAGGTAGGPTSGGPVAGGPPAAALAPAPVSAPAPAAAGPAAPAAGPTAAPAPAAGPTATPPAGPTPAGGEPQAAPTGAGGDTSFLDEAISSAAGAPSPEGQGEAASPLVVAERDELAAATEDALTTLGETSATAAETAGEVEFLVAGPDLAGPNHRSASALASRFLADGRGEVDALVERGREAAFTLRDGAAEKKATLQAEIARHRASTQALASRLRAEAQARALVSTVQVEARHFALLVVVEARALDARSRVTRAYDERVRRLEQARTRQYAQLDRVYQTGREAVLRVGTEKGQQAESRAATHEEGYRQAKGAPPDVQDRVQNKKKDGFWDGYLTYNRYMARADAAREVGKQFRQGFETEAKNRADLLLCGRARDVEITGLIAGKGLESLGCARDNALDSIAGQRASALALAARARQAALTTIQRSLRATLAQLDAREASQLALLKDYGVRQAAVIERDAERAAGALLQGVNDAALQIVGMLGAFRDQVASSEAPPPATVGTQVTAERARLNRAVAAAQAATETAFADSQGSLDDGERQALGALSGLYERGAGELQQLGDGLSQSLQSLVTTTVTNYDQTEAAYVGRIAGDLENSTRILDGVVSGITGIFSQINTGIAARFTESATQMAQGFQKSLDQDLDKKVCAEAEKAAADVQPWWKDVLKVLLIIVVIVVVAVVLGPAIIGAVGAAATALAGSLGAGAALAGAIGAWVGPIIGGAIVGAIAGAAIQVGSNAIYNKPLTEGLGRAIIAGAIGGALGGLGGQLGQVLVGRFAATAFSRIAIQYGTDAVFNVVGSVLGDLAAGNPITWKGVLTGLAIGGAVSVSVGGIGGLARIRAGGAAGRGAGAAPAAEGALGRLAAGRVGRAAERISGIQQRALGLGERVGARAGSFGPRGPTVAETRAALAGARARIEAGELFPRGERPEAALGRPPVVPEEPAPRGAPEPVRRPAEPTEPLLRPVAEEAEGARGRPPVEEGGPGRPPVEEAGPPPAPRRRPLTDSTDPNDPRVRQELDELGPITPETRQMLAENPRLRQALLENPAAARALKRCASPCFPTNMDPADVERLGRFLASNPDIDPSRLVDYLYQHRGSAAELTAAIDSLLAAPNPRAFVETVELPNRVTAADLDSAVVARLEAEGIPRATFDELAGLGYPSDVLQQALSRFRGVLGAPTGELANFVTFLRSFGAGPKPRALVQALEQLQAGGAAADAASDFISRVSNMYTEPTLRPLDVDALRARYDAGDALLAHSELQSGITPDKPHVVMDGYILQTPSAASPSKQLSRDWAGRVDFVIVDRGAGLELVIGKEHSGLSGGARAVYGAGELQFNRNGQITGMTNQSGHYRPTAANLERSYRWLVDNGHLDPAVSVTRTVSY